MPIPPGSNSSAITSRIERKNSRQPGPARFTWHAIHNTCLSCPPAGSALPPAPSRPRERAHRSLQVWVIHPHPSVYRIVTEQFRHRYHPGKPRKSPALFPGGPRNLQSGGPVCSGRQRSGRFRSHHELPSEQDQWHRSYGRRRLQRLRARALQRSMGFSAPQNGRHPRGPSARIIH